MFHNCNKDMGSCDVIMNKVLKNYILNLSYQIIIAVIPIFFLPIISRRLGASSIGIYSYVNSIAYLLVIIGQLGINTYARREIAYNNTEKGSVKNIFHEIYALEIYLLLIVSGIYGVIIAFNDQYRIYFIIYYSYILGSFLDISWLFIGLEQMKTVVIRNFIIKVVNFVFVFIFVKNPSDLWIYLLITGVSTFLGIIVMYPSAKDYFKGLKFYPLSYLKYHLLASAKLFLPQMASQVYVQSGKLILMWQVSSQILGFYEQCEKISKMPLSLMTALTTVIMPRIANESHSKNKDYAKYLIYGKYVIELFMIPITFGLFALAEEFLVLYLGKEFEGAKSILKILAFCIIPISISNITGSQYLVALNKTKILTFSYTLAAIFNLICNFVFVPIIKGDGAAISILLTEWIVACIQYYYLRKIVNFQKGLFNYFPSIFSGIIMCILLFVLKKSLYSGIASFIVLVFIGAIIYYFIYLIINWNTMKNFILKIYNKTRKKE